MNARKPGSKRRESTNLIPSKRRRFFRDRRQIAILSISLVATLGLIALLTVPPAQSAVRSGQAAKNELTAAQRALEKQEFGPAVEAAERAAADLISARRSTRKLMALYAIPVVGTQLRAADVVLDVGINLTQALRDGTTVLKQILEPIQSGKEEISLATLTPADKRKILDRLAESSPLLESIRGQIAAAVTRFRNVPTRGVLPVLSSVIDQVQAQLPFLDQAVANIIPATQIIPSIAGFPDQKTYLFLMENNTELRPTGGFIGTYGILKVSSGEITSFATSDVYHLDNPVKDTLRVEPPPPLRRYNATTQWFFRDSNWSPDFPTAAQKALEFYRLERGPEKNIDGVIAVTPTFISSLLKISGDITVDGMTFTAANLIDKLQPRSERKELIGEMSKILLNRILALPQRRWQELITAVTTALTEKQMLLYAREAALQSRILEQHWGGAVEALTVDGLTVIDANLAGLKTDSVMDRTLAYTLNAGHSEATATLGITYTNRGKISARTTRYRTYTRVYLPLGSTLISSQGAMRDDKLRGGGQGTVDVSEELGRTVLGAFISIEPGETGTLTFSYRLPTSITNAINNGKYELLVQKQPGTLAHGFNASLNFPRSVRSASGVDATSRIGHTGVALKTDLQKDRRLVVDF